MKERDKMIREEQFLATLSAMTWVQKRFHQEQEIADDAPLLVLAFGSEVGSAVKDFNRLYAGDRAVSITGRTSEIILRRVKKDQKNIPGSTVQDNVLTIAINPTRISCDGFGKAQFTFALDGDGLVSMIHETKAVNPREASQIALESFLFDE